MSSRLPHVLFGLYLATAFVSLIWPGYTWAGNRIEPFVLGLPFSFAWTIGWVLATFVALVLYHGATEKQRERTS